MNDHTISRRELLKRAVVVGGACAAAPLFGKDFTKPDPKASDLTAYSKNNQIQFRWNNLPLTVYRAQPKLKYPYFYPLNSLQTGLSATTESNVPYPHHRGLWLGCEPLNGGDYWADNELSRGHILSQSPTLGKTTKTSAHFTDACLWLREDAPSPLKDTRSFTISVPSERYWLLDIAFELTALEDISIKSAKHSFFAMRAAADLSPSYGGILMNSEGGVGAKGTYGKTANWCGYHGKRRLRPDVTEGIAIMNHPDNFGGGCPWFTRDYGHLSPSPFTFLEKGSWTLPKGETLSLKYRIVTHSGTPKEAGLDALFEEWSG